MTIETLIVTIDREDNSLAERMNVQTDALIGNQCSRDAVEQVFLGGHKVTFYCTTGRGVGINRNLLLDKSNADICVFADDDMVFVEGYPEITAKAFGECSDADAVIFNLIEKNPHRHVNSKVRRIRWYNFSRYGAARLALKRESIRKAGIRFDKNFGGGALYCSGEDSIFLRDCLKKGLKVYAVPYAIAEIDQEAESTWFNGYSDKFFYDKGALYACLHHVMWFPFILRFVIKRRKSIKGSISFRAALLSSVRGARDCRKERK